MKIMLLKYKTIQVHGIWPGKWLK